MLIEMNDTFHFVSRISYHNKPDYDEHFYCGAELGSVSGSGIEVELRDWDMFMELVRQTDDVMQKAKVHYEALRVKENESKKDESS